MTPQIHVTIEDIFIPQLQQRLTLQISLGKRTVTNIQPGVNPHEMFPVVQPAEHKQDVLAEGGKQEAAQERGAIGAEATTRDLTARSRSALGAVDKPLQLLRQHRRENPQGRSTGAGASASISPTNFFWSEQVDL